jgi:cell wall-associated NlpC family hydrolase
MPRAASRIARQREAVIAEAWTWVGTPWRHNQALKGHGVDCGRFLIEVYREAGVIPPFDPGNYSRQWNLHRSEEVYLDHIQTYAKEITVGDLGPGDVAIFKYGLTYSHAGIVFEAPRLLHSMVRQGVVIGDFMQDAPLKDHEPRFFSPWST